MPIGQLWKMLACLVLINLHCKRRDPVRQAGSSLHDAPSGAQSPAIPDRQETTVRFFLRLRQNNVITVPRSEYSSATIHVDLTPAPARRNRTRATVHFVFRFYVDEQLCVLEGSLLNVIGEMQGRLLRCAIGCGFGGIMNMSSAATGTVIVDRIDNTGFLFSVRDLELSSANNEHATIELLRVRATGYRNLLEVPKALSYDLDDDRIGSPSSRP